jgi:hypothetical protein
MELPGGRGCGYCEMTDVIPYALERQGGDRQVGKRWPRGSLTAAQKEPPFRRRPHLESARRRSVIEAENPEIGSACSPISIVLRPASSWPEHLVHTYHQDRYTAARAGRDDFFNLVPLMKPSW